MTQERVKELALLAQDIRITGLKMVQGSRSGHLGGAFSMAELMAVLYFDKMNGPARAARTGRNGTALCSQKVTARVALYPTLAMRGFFPADGCRNSARSTAICLVMRRCAMCPASI